MARRRLPEAFDVHQRREVDRALVLLALESPLRSAWWWLLNLEEGWRGMPTNYWPVWKIVVADKESGEVLWVNHGYKPADDPEGAYEALCQEIDYFTLDGFLRRRRPGYWRGGRPWR